MVRIGLPVGFSLPGILGKLFPKGLQQFDKTKAAASGGGLASGIGLGVGIGAGSAVGAGVGGSAVSIAMVPFNAVNNYLGSFWFGAGMILGERWVYQEVWPKVKAKLDAGEDYMSAVEPFIVQAQTMLMKNAEIIGKDTANELSEGALSFLTDILKGDFEALATPEVTGTTDVPHTTEKKIITKVEIEKKHADTQAEINKVNTGKMKEYTTFINQLVKLNQLIKSYNAQKAKAAPTQKKFLTNLIKTTVEKFNATKRAYETWRKNNKRWLAEHPTL